MAAKSSMGNSTTWLHVLIESIKDFFKEDGLRLSAALAFYTAFSLAPLLLIAIAIAGTFFGHEAVRGALDGELKSSMGPSAALVVQDMVANARKPAENILMSIIGVGLLLFGAAGAFGQMQAALNKVWNIEPPPRKTVMSYLKDRFLSFSMVLGCGFLLLLSMLLTTSLQAMSDYIDKMTSIPLTAWIMGSGLLSFGVITALFAAIFKFLPDIKISWKDVWSGALFTAGLFMLGKYVIAWYLARQATQNSYGAAGSFALVLTWLYYSSIILLIGAEFTQSYSRRRGHRASEQISHKR
jgi:membrane protein